PCQVPGPVPQCPRDAGRQRRRARHARVQHGPRRAPRQRRAERAHGLRCVLEPAQRRELRRRASCVQGPQRRLLAEEPPCRDRLHGQTVSQRKRSSPAAPDSCHRSRTSTYPDPARPRAGSPPAKGRRSSRGGNVRCKMQMSFRFIPAAAFVAAVAFFAAAPQAHAQRLSLAERVAKLEQQAQSQNGAQANIELVNQINALQAQVQTLQGQVEELRHQVEEMRSRAKDQYIDLDSRIGRLEGRTSGAPAAAGGPGAVAANNGQMQDIPLGGPGGNAPPPAQNVPPGAVQSAAGQNLPPEANLQTPPPGPNPADEKTAYDQAFSALKDGRYAESARRFQGFIDQYPASELTPNAYYWLG